MSEGFRVDRAVLAAHAAEVGALADRTHRAARAAAPLQRDAYGLVGQVFAAVVDGTSRTAAAAVDGLADAVRRHGTGLEACHGGYDQVERDIAARLRNVR